MGNKQRICKWEKQQLSDDLQKLKKIIGKPRYVCIKCGRASRKKGYLCRPVGL